MNEMIETAACTLDDVLGGFDSDKKPNRFGVAARAVLDTLHEPTQAMVDAGSRALPGHSTVIAAACWRAMHKAMMEEK